MSPRSWSFIPLLQEVTAHPDRLERVAGCIANMLNIVSDRKAFREAIARLLGQICEVVKQEDFPLISRMFKRIEEMVHMPKLCEGPKSPSRSVLFIGAFDSWAHQRLELTSRYFSTCRKRLSLMSALFSANLIFSVVKYHLKDLLHVNTELSWSYQLLLLRTCDMSVEYHANGFAEILEQCLSQVQKAMRNGQLTDARIVADFENFRQSFSRMQYQWQHPTSSRKRGSSTVEQQPQSDLRFSLTNSDDQPASSSDLRSSLIAVDQTSQPESLRLTRTIEQQPQNDLRRSLQQTSSASTPPCRVIDLSSPENIEVQLPPPLPSRLRQVTPPKFNPPPISSLMETLSRDLGYLNQATDIIRSVLLSRTSNIVFQDVQEILTAAHLAASEPALANCIKLIVNLKDLLLKPAGDPGVLFQDVVASCAVQTIELQSLEQVKHFCTSFRLTNALYRAGILPLDVFQYYASTMASGNDEVSFTVMFNLMKNLDSLLDEHVVQLSEEECRFWDSGFNRLFLAVKTKLQLFRPEFVVEVLDFFRLLDEKGGWRRQRVAVPITTRIVAPSNVQKANEVAVPPPPPIISPLPQRESQQVPIAVLPEPTTIVTNQVNTSHQPPQIATLSMDIPAFLKAFSLTRKNVEDVKEKLRSILSPFGFITALETIMLHLFERTDSEDKLNEAADICILMSQKDFGRGKNFTAELQTFCREYVGGRNSSDLEKLSNALKAKQTGTVQDRKQTTNKISRFESVYYKRRIGCSRLVGRLFQREFLCLEFVVSFADCLLSTASEHAFECLLALFTDVGSHFAAAIFNNGFRPWFNEFFAELDKKQLSQSFSEPVKLLIREIISLKEQWSEVDRDARKKSREALEALFARLTPELLLRCGSNTQGEYAQIVAQVNHLIAVEFSDQHNQQFLSTLLQKIDHINHRLSERVQLRASSVNDKTSPVPSMDTPPSSTSRDSQLPHLKRCYGEQSKQTAWLPEDEILGAKRPTLRD